MNAGEEKGEKINTEDTEETGEHREGGRDPSAGLRQRRRPQDDDARRFVRDAEKGEKINTEDTEKIGEHRDNSSYGRCSVYA
jgi:hypothetical protein